MKKNLGHYILFILIIALIITSSIFLYKSDSYADNIKVIGYTQGLKITPEDRKMFDLKNLNPGDTKESEITLENKYEDCYIKIFIRTERTSKLPDMGEADLFKQLKLTLYLDEAIIYSGSMDKFASENKSLGTLAANKSKRMRAVVHLPGSETGNEFQGKEIIVNWVFTAELKCPGEDPDPKPDPDSDPDPEIPVEEEEEEIVVPDEEEDIEEPGEELPEDKEDSKEEEGLEEKENLEEQGEPEEQEDHEVARDPDEKPQGPKSPDQLNALVKPLYKIDRLVETGATSDIIYFGLGGLILALGRGIYKKKE